MYDVCVCVSVCVGGGGMLWWWAERVINHTVGRIDLNLKAKNRKHAVSVYRSMCPFRRPCGLYAH